MICRWFYMVLQFKKKGLQCYKFGNQWWCFPAQTSGLSWKRFTILCVPFLVLIPTIIQSHWGLAVAHPRILEVALTVPWKNPFHVRSFSCKSYRKTSKNHHRKNQPWTKNDTYPSYPLIWSKLDGFPPFQPTIMIIWFLVNHWVFSGFMFNRKPVSFKWVQSLVSSRCTSSLTTLEIVMGPIFQYHPFLEVSWHGVPPYHPFF